ncbi:MAG TPA: hypothetical protein VGD23_08710 [Sphingomicrobium sp.]
MTNKTVYWHADSHDPALASIRLRMLLPMEALRELGYDVRPLTGALPADASLVIFSKSLSADALVIAEQAAARGQPIVYDICDNVFEKPSRNDQDEARKQRVRRMMELAKIVTIGTQPLADLLAREVPAIAAKTEIIADALEGSRPLLASASLMDRARLWLLRRFLRRNADALRLIWFGKCKKGYAGIEHLDPVVRLLETLPLPRPVTLTVVSNRRKIYRRSASKWQVPKFYLPWSLATFDTALRLHDVAIIPVDRNDYTVGKSINRPATALMAGLGVIADPIPAYEELAPFIYLGDWERGLIEYAGADPRKDRRIGGAQSYLRQRYGAAAIAECWADIIDRALAKA